MQIGDVFVVMVETTITANGKTIENPIIRVTKSGSGNPSFVYFIDNQTVGQPRHWYVGDGSGNVVLSDVDVVDSTTSTALATALTNQLTAAGYLSGSHTGTVNDVPETYTKIIHNGPVRFVRKMYDNDDFMGLAIQMFDGTVRQCSFEGFGIEESGSAVNLRAPLNCSDYFVGEGGIFDDNPFVIDIIVTNCSLDGQITAAPLIVAGSLSLQCNSATANPEDMEFYGHDVSIPLVE